MTNNKWRAFVGEPGHRVMVDVRDATWEQARDALVSFARKEMGDDTAKTAVCLHCFTQARGAIGELSGLPEGEPWKGDLDWDELILATDNTHIEGEPAGKSS